MRPVPWTPKPVRTLWLDWQSASGVTDEGTRVQVKVGERRVKPNLADLLDTAFTHGATRIMLTEAPTSPTSRAGGWLLVTTPGWKANGHWLGSDNTTGRFAHEKTGAAVEVRTVAEWFEGVQLRAAEAREAWLTTARFLEEAVPGATLFLTPGATGTNVWALSLPRGHEFEPVSDDIAEELHSTSGQHRYEHLVKGPNACDCGNCLALVDPETAPRMSEFSYVDGRFMYAALCRELGTGPGVRLRRAEAYDLMESDPYARARYLVTATVPDRWDHVGVLAVKHPGDRGTWHYPNRPGARFETWADAAEVAVAQKAGWLVEPHEAIVFRKTKVLDTFAARLIRARERVAADDDLDATIRRAVVVALRAILIQSIGAFASRGRGRTEVVTSANDVPRENRADVVRYGDLFVFTVPQPTTARQRPFSRPELAVQVWARGRARVLSAPAGAGALSLDPRTLIGINGDAIYSSSVPAWSLPVEHGGVDDGRVGRLRLQGVTRGRLAIPTTISERDALKARAEKAGPAAAWEATR